MQKGSNAMTEKMYVDKEYEVISLELEGVEGEVEFAILGYYELDGNEYVYLCEISDDTLLLDDEHVVFLQVMPLESNDPNEMELANIDDEELYERLMVQYGNDPFEF